MDGYIKNKKEAIRSARVTILWCYALTFPIMLFILVWLFDIYTLGSPDDWKTTEIVYSHFSSERIGFRKWKSDVLITGDGRRFDAEHDQVSADLLKEALIPGETYTLVYSDSISGIGHMEALYNGQEQFLERSVSVALWEEKRRECFLGLYITIGLELVALILIDRFLCRKTYAEIRKLNQAIKRRQAKLDCRKSP